MLLKNAANTLPLAKTGFTNVAVVGPRADTVLRDWYGGLAPYKITGRQGIATKLGTGVTVLYAADNNGNAATSAAMTAAAVGRTGDRVRRQPPDLRHRAARAEPDARGASARRSTRGARRSTA